MLSQFELSNGIKVLTYFLPYVKSVHFEINVKAGSVFEDEKNNGIAHFMEHVLGSGTPSLASTESLFEFVDDRAGSFNMSTGKFAINFYMTLPREFLDDVVKIGSEVFFSSFFKEEFLEKERKIVTNEYKQKVHTPGYKNHMFFAKNRYVDGHNLALGGLGTPETIARVSLDDLISYWNTHFTPTNAYILVVGNFDSSQLKDSLERHFGKVSSKKIAPPYPTMSGDDFKDRGVFIRHDSEYKTNNVSLTFPSIYDKIPLKDRLAVNLGVGVLGGLHASRLKKLLRFKHGYVYVVSASSVRYPDIGYSYISAPIPIIYLDDALEVLLKELKSYFHDGPTKEEFETVKHYRIYRSAMAFDVPSGIVSWFVDEMLFESEVHTPDDYISLYKSIKRKDVIDAFEKYFDFSKLQLTIQGQVEESKENVSKYTQMISVLE